jgi:dolichol-phosphate mannosyltransferase
MGFKQTPFFYERDPRHAGSTKYSLKKMIRFASTGIFYFSKKPLKIATTFGFLSMAAGFLLSLWLVFNKIFKPEYLVSGWTSLVLTVIYFSGVQLLTIGILGQYVGSLFDEIKKRPEYIIDEMTRLDYERDIEQSTRRSDFGELRPSFALVSEDQQCGAAHARPESVNA